MATGPSRWWPWEHQTHNPLPFRSCRIVDWWMGTPQPTCAAISPARRLSQAHWHSKSFSAGAEKARLSCFRDIRIAMLEGLILD